MNHTIKRLRDTRLLVKTICDGILDESLRVDYAGDLESRSNLKLAFIRLEEAAVFLRLVEASQPLAPRTSVDAVIEGAAKCCTTETMHRHLTDNFSPQANPPGSRAWPRGEYPYSDPKQPPVDNTAVEAGCEKFSTCTDEQRKAKVEIDRMASEYRGRQPGPDDVKDATPCCCKSYGP